MSSTTKEYDLIAIGSGSAMNIVELMITENPKIKVAVIDKDEAGGICLTRGCIPSKLMLYPAELVRTIEQARELGIETEIKKVDFDRVMKRMRSLIDEEIKAIGEGLSNSENIDYYHATAEFVSPYTLKVNGEIVSGKMIILATGSRPAIPPIKGLDRIRYHTSDSVIRMELGLLPESIAIVGGGYIAVEFGHFFSAMGSRVTILGRNSRLIPGEEPEVSSLAKRELAKHMMILTDHEVREVEQTPLGNKKRLVAVDRRTGESRTLEADEIIVAAGRAPVNDILHPERSNIRTSKDGWIEVNEYLETSQPNIWALGDADGRYLFKHVANYESEVVYYNAVLKKKVKVDYHAIPHAVFAYPEIAAVGMGEREAVEKYGKDGILIGIQRYQDTAKGEAMNVRDYFVKVILQKENSKILGSHIIGPYASILIQEVVNLMYTEDRSARPMLESIHIHPSLSEVVQRAFGAPTDPDEYHHLLEHHYGLEAM